jgi:hypothetical protein
MSDQNHNDEVSSMKTKKGFPAGREPPSQIPRTPTPLPSPDDELTPPATPGNP